MKIAMPYQDGVLLEHFGRAKEFIIYNVSDLDPVTSEVIAPEDLSHAAVARVLKEHGVDVVLCGSIGEHARQAVEGEHMLVFSGITGAADDVLERFLQGNLEAVDGDFAAAHNPSQAEETIRTQISKTGDTIYAVSGVEIRCDEPRFVPVAVLNALRRTCIEKLDGNRSAAYPGPVRRPENYFYPDFDAIEKAGLDGVKMMLVNYPNMPTGQTPSMELFKKIIDFGARHNILIVHDNPYSFIRNAEHPISIMEAEGAKDVALEMNSLSKGHSMAGWRVGVVVGKKEWIDSILTFKSNMDSGMFYPIQAAADTALALGEEWFKELNDIYYGREKQAYELLDALGCRYRKGQAGLFVWAELPEGYEGDSFAFSDEVMEKTDVFLTPGGIFGSEGNGYIRITLCCPEALLKKATEKIKAAFGK